MKVHLIIVAIFIMCLFSACNTGNKESGSGVNNSGVSSVEAEGYDDPEVTEVSVDNRATIANALGIEENDRSIRFILAGLDAIEVGKIIQAEKLEENGETVLDIVSEDKTNYRIYLSQNGSIEAIKNTDSGEWVVESMR